MAIGFNEVAFLKYCGKNRSFGKTATLGRQRIIYSKYLNQIIKYPKNYDFGKYQEKLLTEVFNSSSIDVYDNSGFEGANKILDFGESIKEFDLYDTFIDYGSSEHIFNISQSFKNIIQLTKVGGMIIHALPTDNSCGHGFYQISPELFFTLYTPENGFENTEIFMIDISKSKPSFVIKLERPEKGERFEIKTKNEMSVWVKTTKKATKEIKNIFQSDYEHAWEGNYQTKKTLESSVADHLKKSPEMYKFLRKFYRIFYIKNFVQYMRYLIFYKKFENYINLGKKIYIRDL